MFGGSDHYDSEYGGSCDNKPSRHNDHWESKNGGHGKVKWHASQDTRETSTPTPSIPLEPSETYLATSLKPSYRTSQPSPKLLILDLNGTLLYRLPPPPRSRSRYQVYSESSPAPSRTTYLRPYFPSFRRYLFHATTRAWLDVMVWSSAQPHSVKSMLKLCFPREEEDMETSSGEAGMEVKTVDDRFFAVWARDTLGLSRSDYARKTQTIKNLEKVWTEFAAIPRSPVLISGDTTSESNSPTNDALPFSHSSLSTLLLDDSPLKARLQPWNHLCIKEYDQAIWKEDTLVVQSLSRYEKSGKEFTGSETLEENSVEHLLDPSGESNSTTGGVPVSELEESNVEETNLSTEIPDTQTANHEISYVRTQPHDSVSSTTHNQTNNTHSYSPSAPVSPHAVSLTNTIPDSEPSPHLDETLLAVIGILEELKYQSNISGWFRNRSLWSISDGDDDEIATADNQGSATVKEDMSSQTMSEDRLVSTPPSSSLYSSVMSLSSEDVQDMPIPGLSSMVTFSPSPSAGLKRSHQDAEPERIKTKRQKSSNGVVISPQDEAVFPSSHHTAPLFWFEDRDVLDHWVRQGRQTLRDLDILELHGLNMSVDYDGRGP